MRKNSKCFLEQNLKLNSGVFCYFFTLLSSPAPGGQLTNIAKPLVLNHIHVIGNFRAFVESVCLANKEAPFILIKECELYAIAESLYFA